MQSNKESSSRLIKKCGIRKISTHKHKIDKPHDNQQPLSKSKLHHLSDKSIKTSSQIHCPYCGSSTISLLDRFKELEKKYSDTLQIIKNRTQLYESQKKQLERLRASHERDRKQINQLRTMLGFMKRVDANTQTREQEFRQEIKIKKINQWFEDESKNAQMRVLQTPKRDRKQKPQQSYAYYSHNYSSESAKTLPQRKRISKNENEQEMIKAYECHQNLRKSRKKSEEASLKSPEQTKPLYHSKLSTSSFSRLRFKYSEHT